jgi:hypothetical protein
MKLVTRLIAKATVAAVIAAGISGVVALVRKRGASDVTMDTWPDVPENPNAA